MKFVRDANGKLKKVSGIRPPRYEGYELGDPVKIVFGIVKCQFTTPYPRAIDSALTVPYPGYIHSPKYKANQWDGMKRFMTRAGYFPTGLLPVVYALLKTGNNPLIPEGKNKHKVLRILPKKITILTKKGGQNYHFGFANFYVEYLDVLGSLNEEQGTFAYPATHLNGWKKVANVNPLAGQVLSLAKSLYQATN